MRIKKVLTIFLMAFIIFFLTSTAKAVTIVLDAGHGGHDTGAISNNVYEKTINLKVTKYLNEYLKEYENVNIILTRNDDTFLEVFDRSMIAREKKADLMISLHFNSVANGTKNGAEVYVSANTSLDKYYKETSILGNKILANLEKVGIANNGVKTRLIPTDETDVYSDGTRADYYGIIRYAMRGCKIDSGEIKPEGAVPAKVEAGEGIPAMIIEHCYINNKIDQAFFDSEEDLRKLAKADGDAIVEYYQLIKKEHLKFKIKEQFIIAEPDTTLENIKQKYKDVVADKMVTGSKIKIEGKEYKLVKLGDCNGDGAISPADYVKVKNHIMKVTSLKDENKMAADVNEDGKISPADYVKVKNHIMKASKIEIK